MSKELSDVRLSDLLPDSIAQDDNVRHSAEALDKQLLDMTSAVDLPSIYVSIDKLTSTQLDHVAYGWDASVWRDSWPVSMKRSVLKNVVREKRKKGTLRAVKDAVASIGSAATIKEWWQQEPKGTPHTFEIQATLGNIEGTLDSEMQEDLFALIDDAKPVRSHYTFVLVRQLQGGMGVDGYLRPVAYSRIRSEAVESADVDAVAGVFVAARPIAMRSLVGLAK
ncbi:phage tail protein I [Sutterella wadsworthensis 2_1_59BFAA]|uniref:Phage tail protein I n=1 Tax=Sutterella wadsworthensis 2_1_59BFAA TaxID=742823 RepID=K1KKI1_9BURK|nr:phage tail protein I [Sutterella wadsworthensis]EKB32189.1 phage tail protein I [Sutterella wadsworthensis 2_1_59BFAA]